MKENTLRIATRRSPLALWQAHFVKESLEKKHPNL
ncbi:hydroxymethylbilane synthase, partial [Gammaproteobacteria bacterium]|nr:hydroxymethylbilane synthase [Gammaproteobacteria bacterium]